MPGRRGAGSRGLSKRKTPANSQREEQGKPRAAKYREKARVVGRGKREQVPGVGSWGL